MKANPGGRIPASDVYGRDELIRHVWLVLEHRSVVLEGLRRIGKTQIITKVTEEVPVGKLAVYRDLEGLRSPMEFAEVLFRDVQDYLGKLQRTAHRVQNLLQQLTGAEFSGFKFPEVVTPHWKTVLTNTAQDLAEHQDRVVIFFWDEVPLMLYNVKHDCGELAAMELLDTLRSLRQMYPNLRMVFTGSLSLHIVITSLKRLGYANDPTNDMDTLDVPPLSPTDAQNLARELILGENVQTRDPHATAAALAESVDGIPYLIHQLVEQLVLRGNVADADTVRQLVGECLTNPADRWHLAHYRDRLDTYYASGERNFALALLDVLSVAPQPLAFEDLFNLLKARMVTEDVEMARSVLSMLQRDQYVLQQSDWRFRFRFPLIQRWWSIHRGLAA